MRKLSALIVALVIGVTGCGSDGWSAPEPTEEVESYWRVKAAAGLDDTIGDLCDALDERAETDGEEQAYKLGEVEFVTTWTLKPGDPDVYDLWAGLYDRCDLPVYGGR